MTETILDDECEFYVQCAHCSIVINPYEETVYCWSVPMGVVIPSEGNMSIFVCGGCDAEHRVNYSTTCKVKKWRSDHNA
jgi:hypothetical protein